MGFFNSYRIVAGRYQGAAGSAGSARTYGRVSLTSPGVVFTPLDANRTAHRPWRYRQVRQQPDHERAVGISRSPPGNVKVLTLGNDKVYCPGRTVAPRRGPVRA